MIRKLAQDDKAAVIGILGKTGNFTENEINIAVELINIYLSDPNQKDYELFVDDQENIIRGYVCFGPRPLTAGTFDLYWIAVNPESQSKGIGSNLLKFVEDYLKYKKGRLIIIETSGKDSYEKERLFYMKNMYKKLVEINDFYDENDSLVIYGKYI